MDRHERQRRAIPELSLDTQTCERLLATVPIGGIMPYQTLTEAIGADVQREARHHVARARIRLHRDQHVVFGAVTNIGLKRLNDEGKVSAASGHVTRGRTQFRKARHTATAVDDFDKLPNATKLTHNIVVAQAGVILHMTRPQTTKKLEDSIGDKVRQKYDLRSSLALMKGTI